MSISRRSALLGSAAASVTILIPGRTRAASVTELKMATPAPKQTPWHRHFKKYKGRVEKETGDQLAIKTYWGGSMGDEASVADAVKDGSRLHVYAGSSGGLAQLVPELQGLELPFLFDSFSSIDKALDGNFDVVDEVLKKRGFKLLFFSENGYRSIGVKIKDGEAFDGLNSLAGKSMRSQPVFVHQQFWKGLGCRPEPLPVTAVEQALTSGKVQGFDNSALFAFATSWYKHITHFWLTKHIYQPGIVVISKKVWDDLPAGHQKALLGKPALEAAYSRKKVRAIRQALIDNFAAVNVKVETLSDADRKTLQNKTKAVHAKFKAKYKGGKTLVEALEASL